MRVVAAIEFIDGTRIMRTFSFSAWQHLWRTGQLEGKKVDHVEVESSSPEKMANRVVFKHDE